MINRTRREFLGDVGRGMLIASLGSALTFDLGLSSAYADVEPTALSFGELEPLVALMQETAPDKLMPLLVEKLATGTELRTLVAAGALANARTFGGEDYIGFHTLMALAPAYEMSRELPTAQQALPVLKVLYRNSNRIQETGGRSKEVLHAMQAQAISREEMNGEYLRDLIRKADVDAAERTFAAMAQEPVGDAFNFLQPAVHDDLNVHRVVLAWRAYSLLELTGKDQAHTMLRQSVRSCIQFEQEHISRGHPTPAIRAVLPKLLDEYKLMGRELGTRKAEDGWVEKLSQTIYGESQEHAAGAVAAAIAEGMDPEAIGEAISLAANQLALRDRGRIEKYASAGKPAGSTHGDSYGVHASDAANAWRNIARVSNSSNSIASLIVGAYHTAGQSESCNCEPHPIHENAEVITEIDAAVLLRETEAAIRAREQVRACALAHRYGELGHAPRPILDIMLGYAVSEDGALHAEKYYRTVHEEFEQTRPTFRWRQIAALARVTASEFGYPAPGLSEVRELLKA